LPSGGTTPGPRLEKQAGEGDRQENAQKKDLKKTIEAGWWVASHYRGAARLARFMSGPQAGMNRDSRV